MRRSTMPPRADWQRRCEDVGFYFHSLGGRYWEEAACYVLSGEEVDILEAAAEELQRLCLEACEHIHSPGAVQYRRDTVGRRQTKIVVAMHADLRLVDVAHIGPDGGNQVSELVR